MSARVPTTRRAPPPPRRRSFRLPNGDRLERRILPALSPRALASPLHFGALNDADVSHFLSVPDEVDVYSLAMQRGETIKVSLVAQQNGSTLEGLLRIFDAQGRPLAIDDQQGGDPRMTFQAAIAGTYYIGVSSAPNDSYDPSIANGGVPGDTIGLYKLDVTESTSTLILPDMTGSVFRTGVDMAAPGDVVPVNFTVEN